MTLIIVTQLITALLLPLGILWEAWLLQPDSQFQLLMAFFVPASKAGFLPFKGPFSYEPHLLITQAEEMERL